MVTGEAAELGHPGPGLGRRRRGEGLAAHRAGDAALGLHDLRPGVELEVLVLEDRAEAVPLAGRDGHVTHRRHRARPAQAQRRPQPVTGRQPQLPPPPPPAPAPPHQAAPRPRRHPRRAPATRSADAGTREDRPHTVSRTAGTATEPSPLYPPAQAFGAMRYFGFR
ncbi:MAG TPA: hypothetical protein DEH11_16880 [Actinobacteria bacterium]|nr:hypothetical protein [Actinomycetota bacterium]